MTEKSTIRELHTWRDETTLVPFSGIQFLDFGFDRRAISFKTRGFVERTTASTAEGDERTLLVLTGDDDKDEKLIGAEQPDDDAYSINLQRALEPFLEKWTPVPVLRIRPSADPNGREQYDAGPTCWSRVLIRELPDPDPETGHTHRVVLAFDTTCEKTESALFYQAPSTEDGERLFRFVSNTDDIGWFVSRIESDDSGNVHDQQQWVDEWIYAQYGAVERKSRGPSIEDDEIPRMFEHWARYFTFLALLDSAIDFPRIRLIDTMSRDPTTDRYRYAPIDVDLVIDVGNSRTCGILIEAPQDGGNVNLNESYTLALRDLSDPLHRYNRPFESRVEFSDARFGQGRSARSRSFFWPSLVRVGPEAMRLTKHEEGTETISGISSPKRYLWDDQPRSQDWRFHFFEPSVAEPLPLIARAVQTEMNEAGDVLEQVAKDIKKKLRDKKKVSTISASRPRFSRSATFGLMLSEIFLQAIVQINDPAQRETRKESPIPRRLRTIILTLPSATPLQEQAIIRSRAEGALRLLNNVLRWSPSYALNTTLPEIKVDWDEATCTQMVYLYSEISQRYGGQLGAFLDLKGKPRRQNPEDPNSPLTPSIRVGCIDIGGGTTDLMVMSYYRQGDHALIPRQDFREGFRKAGDDLLQALVSRILMPQIASSLEKAGVVGARNLQKELFVGDTGDTDIRVYRRRRQFAIRVMVPLAVHCLQLAEGMDDNAMARFSVSDVLPPESFESEETANPFAFLERPAQDRGATEWQFADLEFDLRRSELDSVVRDVFEKPLSDLCEIIGHLGCDVLLLSGRPSCLAAVRALVRESLVVAPTDLVSMHAYEVGRWYPYRDPVTNQVQDPKSTAAVGGMLCLLSQSRIVNFMVHTDRIALTSTARFIGLLDNDGAIRPEKVLFSDEEAGRNDSATIDFQGPTFIGFRQLPHQRWTSSIVYRLDFANEQTARRPKPFKVTLARSEFDDDPESTSEMLVAGALKETLEVTGVEDASGAGGKPNDISLRLHTLGIESEYWLDSGVFKI